MSGKRRKKFSMIITVILSAVIISTAVPSFQYDVKANILSDMAGGVIGKIRYNTTVAELIVSLLAGSGVAPTNADFLNKLNSSYGTEAFQLGNMYDQGLFSVSDAGDFIDSGWSEAIEGAAAYQQLPIEDIFECTADDVAAGLADTESSAAQTLGGAALESINKGGFLAKIATGIGVVGAGIGLGIEIDKIRKDFVDWYGRNMVCNAPMDVSNINYMKGYKIATSIWNGREYYMQYPNYCSAYGGRYIVSGSFDKTEAIILNNTSDSGNFYINGSNVGQVYGNTWMEVSKDGFSRIDTSRFQLNLPTFTFQGSNWIADRRTFFNSMVGNPDYTVDLSQGIPSPDVIGVNGNVRSTDIGTTQSPNIITNNIYTNNVENNKAIQPFEWQDFMNWVQNAIQNTQNNNINEEQGQELQNLIQENTVTPEEAPSENPDINYTPSIPEQPTYTDKIPADETDIAASDPYTTPGLRDKFPFCIPFDLASIANIFVSADREAPHIVFPIRSELFGFEYTIDIDFAAFDEAAGLLRLLELIAFIAGLAVATRQLIGA